MKIRPTPVLLALACSLVLVACGDRTPDSAQTATFTLLPDVDPAIVHALGVDALLKVVHFQDKDGEALLVLDRVDTQTTATDDEDALDVAVLSATLFHRATPTASFTQRWRSEQRTECPGLDLDAGYFMEHAGATDLDGDHVAEITLPSHAFCGGGVDPQQIVIELRRGQDVYRVEGESLVHIAGEAPFGGERTDSPSYAAAPPALRRHLDAIWQDVYTLPLGESDGTR